MFYNKQKGQTSQVQHNQILKEVWDQINCMNPLKEKQRKYQYYIENKDTILLKTNQYKKRNKESILKKAKIYYKKNKSRISEYHKNYYQKNKSEILIKTKIYRRSHPQVYLKSTLKMIKKLGASVGKSSYEFVYGINNWSKAIKKRDNETCQICDKPADHAHHIFEKSKYPGLALNLNNGIALCKEHHNEIHF